MQGFGRAAGPVAGDELLDHALAEGRRDVQGEVGDAQGVGAGARQAHGLGRAAGALGGRGRRVVPEAHGHADDVEAAVAQQHRRDGAVHAAAHRDGDAALAGGGPGGAQAGRGPRLERAGDGVLDHLRAVAAGGPQPAEVGVQGGGRQPQRVVEGRAGQARAGRAGGGRGRAAAEGLEAGLADDAVLHQDAHAHQVAAPGAAGLADGVARREGAGARRRRQMAHGLGRVGRHRGRLPTPRPRTAHPARREGGAPPPPLRLVT